MPLYVGGSDSDKKRTGPGWQFARNVIQDLREIGPGMILGPLMLGRDIVSDIGHMDPEMSRTTKTLRGVGRGFMDTSPLIPLAKLDIGEAGERFYDRPISGLLDFTGAAGVGSQAASKLAKGAAFTAPSRAVRLDLMKRAGYERVGKADKLDIGDLPDTLEYRFAPGRSDATIIGDEVFAKPTHRRLLPSADDPLLAPDPRLPRLEDISDLKNISPELKNRLSEIDAWKPVSRTPLWRKAGESVAGARRELIPHDRAFSSSRQMGRKLRRGVEKIPYLSYATARGLHEQNNVQFMDDVANRLRERGMKDVDIESLVDYTAYLSASGYSNVAQRLKDLQATHYGDVQAMRAERKIAESKEYMRQSEALRQQINQMKEAGIDMADPRILELRREWQSLQKRHEQAREAAMESAEFLKKRDRLEPHGADDPSSTLRKEELPLIERLGADLIDDIMQSDAMERWLDDLELAADQAEALAVKNYGLGLSPDQALRNRYRMADLYQPAGVTDETMRLYSRARKDGSGVRSPVFIPMRSRARDAKDFKLGTDKNPFTEPGKDVIGDPMSLELWGQNVRSPITKGLFLKKHAEELHDYHMSKALDKARLMAVPMTRTAAEQWKQLAKHDPDNALTTAGPNGKPHNPNAPFVDIGEFATEADELRFGATELSSRLRELGSEKGANLAAQLAREIAVTFNSKSPSPRISGQVSARQVERSRGMAGEMTTILPTPVYASVVNNMIRTAHLIEEVAGAPSARKSIARGTGEAMKYWRYSILHSRPKWMFNNALGSLYMLAMQEGWIGALSNIMRNSSLFNWARKLLGIDGKKFDRGGTRYLNQVVESKMKDVLYSAGSTSMYGFTDRNLSRLNRIDRFFDKIADFNAKVADNPARAARIKTLLDDTIDRRIAQLEAQGQKVTKSRDEMMIDYLNNPEYRERLAQVALEDMIDFQDLSKSERMVVAFGMPFLSWIKGSSKATARHITDVPGRVMWQKELGLEGARQIEEQFPGGVPSYLLSSLPGGWSGDDPRSVVNLAGASPAQTLADIGAMGISLAGGAPLQFGTETPLGMMGPLVNVPIAVSTYRHPFYGTPFSRNMLPPQVAWEVLQPPTFRAMYKSGYIPNYGLFGQMYKPTGTTIAAHDPMANIGRLIGPMSQTINPAVAGTRYREEQKDLGN